MDEWTGYRLYRTDQLHQAARIKAFRQLGLPVAQIKLICQGVDPAPILEAHAGKLRAQQQEIAASLSVIDHLLKEDEMKYQATIKTIPACIVYYSETTLPQYSDAMSWIPQQGAEAHQLNPDLKCTEPNYEFVEYLDGEYRERDIRVRHSQAVADFGVESGNIKFRQIPETKVLSVYHQGAYDQIGEAYAFIMTPKLPKNVDTLPSDLSPSVSTPNVPSSFFTTRGMGSRSTRFLATPTGPEPGPPPP